MAAINRFTNIDQSQNAYTPRSFEEILKPAAFMRGKHDELLAQKTLYDTEIAKLDSLDVHDEQYMAARQKLEEGLGSITDQLNNEGFSQSAKSNFINFNKDYQNAIGPKGELGLIKGAKEAYDTNRAEHLKAAEAAGQPLDKAIAAFDRHAQAYNENKGLDASGKIVNINQLGAPTYKDSLDLFKDNLKGLGYYGDTTKDLATASIKQMPNGQYVITTESQNEVTKSNIKNIESALNATKVDLFNEESTLGKSNAYNDRKADEELKRLEAFAGAKVIKTKATNTSRKLNIAGSPVSSSNSTVKDNGNGVVSIVQEYNNLTNMNGDAVTKGEDVIKTLEGIDTKLAELTTDNKPNPNLSDEELDEVKKLQLKKSQFERFPGVRQIMARHKGLLENEELISSIDQSFEPGDLFVADSDVNKSFGGDSSEIVYNSMNGALSQVPNSTPFQQKYFQIVDGIINGSGPVLGGEGKLATLKNEKDKAEATIANASTDLETYLRDPNLSSEQRNAVERFAEHFKWSITQGKDNFKAAQVLSAARAMNYRGDEADKYMAYARAYDSTIDKVKGRYKDVLRQKNNAQQVAFENLDAQAMADMKTMQRSYSVSTGKAGELVHKSVLKNAERLLGNMVSNEGDVIQFVKKNGEITGTGSGNVTSESGENTFGETSKQVLQNMLNLDADGHGIRDITYTPVGYSGGQEITIVGNNNETVTISVPNEKDGAGTSNVPGDIVNRLLEEMEMGGVDAKTDVMKLRRLRKFNEYDAIKPDSSDYVSNAIITGKEGYLTNKANASREEKMQFDYYRREFKKFLALQETPLTPKEYDELDELSRSKLINAFEKQND